VRETGSFHNRCVVRSRSEHAHRTFNLIAASLYDKLNFNYIRDIAPVAGIIRVPGVMVVHPSFPVNPEFIAYAKLTLARSTMRQAATEAHSMSAASYSR
jgi:hypothetical protein